MKSLNLIIKPHKKQVELFDRAINPVLRLNLIIVIIQMLYLRHGCGCYSGVGTDRSRRNAKHVKTAKVERDITESRPPSIIVT